MVLRKNYLTSRLQNIKNTNAKLPNLKYTGTKWWNILYVILLLIYRNKFDKQFINFYNIDFFYILFFSHISIQIFQTVQSNRFLMILKRRAHGMFRFSKDSIIYNECICVNNSLKCQHFHRNNFKIITEMKKNCLK